jgi:hypothetical protein
MHVDSSRGTAGGGTFPDLCYGKLGTSASANEKGFEYLLFVLSSCAIGGAPIQQSAPTPPPSPPTLAPATVIRDYHAICPASTIVRWSFFNWQSVVPTGTSIAFTAQTAPELGNGAMDVAHLGASVPIGTANATTSAGTWATGAYGTGTSCAVEDHLQDLADYGSPPRAECPGSTPASQQQSLPWLRVTMTFNPAGSFSPVLSSWEQLYDCVPWK